MTNRHLSMGLLLLSLSTPAAQADDGDRIPMFQALGGVEVAQAGKGSVETSLLIRLDFSGAEIQSGDVFSMYVVRFRGDISVANLNGQVIPYLDLEFFPVGLNIQGTDPRIPGYFDIGVNAVPIHVGANRSIGQNFAVRATAIGVELGRPLSDSFDAKIVAFAKIAVDAIGAKIADYADSRRENPTRFAFGGGALEAGLAHGSSDGKFRISVAVGAKADLAGWFGHSLQSDGSVYAEARSELRDSLSLFVRGAYNYSSLRTDVVDELQLLTGIGFIF